MMVPDALGESATFRGQVLGEAGVNGGDGARMLWASLLLLEAFCAQLFM